MLKGNMAGQFAMLQKMQKEMEKIQAKLEEMTVEGTAGGGMVAVTMNGQQKVTAVKLDPETVDPEDVEMLEDLMVAATNQALEKSKELSQSEMSKVAGGMLGGLPGGMKIPGLM